MALLTKRVYLGTTVTPLPSRLPWKLTREVITLDHLLHGRLIRGVGMGDEQGLHFGEVAGMKQRAKMLDDGFHLLADLVSGQPCKYHGAHYHVDTLSISTKSRTSK